ncbi:MAG: hypothetical protein JSU08_15490 [Acidobacteria bacterium]|nr:hypothetical protein [Acidobacteriota bacterium]
MGRQVWQTVALVILLLPGVAAPIWAEQVGRGALTSVRVSADVSCIVSIDGRAPVRVDAGRPAVIRVAPGAHVFAASLGEEDYWERQVDVTARDTVLHVELIPIVRERIGQQHAASKALELAREFEAAAALEMSAAKALRTSTAELREKGDAAQRVLLEGVESVITQIRSLDGRFKQYSEAAEKQTQDNSALRAEANSQNNGTAVGAIVGLMGNIAAMSGDGAIRRNRLRAAAALRRIDRLTAALSIASDRGFDQLEAAVTGAASFPVTRGKLPGEMVITDGRIEYRETGTSVDGTAFGAACQELRAVKAGRRSITVTTRAARLEVTPKNAQPEDLLGEILLSCPDREF